MEVVVFVQDVDTKSQKQ